LRTPRFLTRSTRDSKAEAQATGPICVEESGAASYRQGSIRRHSIGGVEAGRAFALSGNPAAVVAAQFTFRVGPTWRLTRIAALNAFLDTGDLPRHHRRNRSDRNEQFHLTIRNVQI
jgi:hypothetical protein